MNNKTPFKRICAALGILASCAEQQIFRGSFVPTGETTQGKARRWNAHDIAALAIFEELLRQGMPAKDANEIAHFAEGRSHDLLVTWVCDGRHQCSFEMISFDATVFFRNGVRGMTIVDLKGIHSLVTKISRELGETPVLVSDAA